jgi:hypothetical protein
MSAPLDDLLNQLEQISAEAVKITDPSLNEAVNSIAALETIRQRGDLVQQLNTELTVAEPLSYTDFNRLVIIHYQGSRVEQNLQLTRQQLVSRLASGTRERAYLDCLTSGLDTPRTTRLTNSA